MKKRYKLYRVTYKNNDKDLFDNLDISIYEFVIYDKKSKKYYKVGKKLYISIIREYIKNWMKEDKISIELDKPEIFFIENIIIPKILKHIYIDMIDNRNSDIFDNILCEEDREKCIYIPLEAHIEPTKAIVKILNKMNIDINSEKFKEKNKYDIEYKKV